MEQEKQDHPPPEPVTRTPDQGLLVDLGPQRRKAIERLKRGEGALTQRIRDAVEQHCDQLGVGPGVEIVPVVLLYRLDKPEYVVIRPAASRAAKGSPE